MAEGLPIKSAWGRKPEMPTVETSDERPIVSFAEIMSEQLASHIQEDELEQDIREQMELEAALRDSGFEVVNAASMLDGPDTSRDAELALELSQDPDISADEALARKLQREFDREQELSQQFEQNRSESGIARATVGPDPYNYLANDDDLELSSDGEDDDDFREHATNLLYQRMPDFGPSGLARTAEGVIISKHDRSLTATRNRSRAVTAFPLSADTGDVEAEEPCREAMNNKVFNHLRAKIQVHDKRSARVKDKEEKATEMSVDAMTRLILFKWINSGELDSVDEIIATGKESVVLHAVGNDGSPNESHFAVKVYKMTLNNFKNRVEYVKDDFRFKNPRRVMKVWAEKELLNLKRLNRHEIRCPVPIHLKKHVLLMSMIGDKIPAPRLKNVEWEDEESKVSAFAQVKDIMIRMYTDCKLVHGDLSEFNLLYHEGNVYVIDVAQAVDVSHPRCLVFLVRDVENILNFFGHIGVDDLPTSTALFNEIAQLDMVEGKDLLSQVDSFETENRDVSFRQAKHQPAVFAFHQAVRDNKDRADADADAAEAERIRAQKISESNETTSLTTK